jgi:hypothetical protein
LVCGDVELSGLRRVGGRQLAGLDGDLVCVRLVACGKSGGALLKGNAGSNSG